jgi:hypothetical protein
MGRARPPRKRRQIRPQADRAAGRRARGSAHRARREHQAVPRAGAPDRPDRRAGDRAERVPAQGKRRLSRQGRGRDRGAARQLGGDYAPQAARGKQAFAQLLGDDPEGAAAAEELDQQGRQRAPGQARDAARRRHGRAHLIDTTRSRASATSPTRRPSSTSCRATRRGGRSSTPATRRSSRSASGCSQLAARQALRRGGA